MSEAAPAFIDGIGAIANDYDAFILDIWGVLHDGIAPYPGTIDCLDALRQAGKRIVLLSNTPDRQGTIAARLAEMGIGVEFYDHIVTAGDSAHADIAARAGQSCWYAGSDGMRRLTEGLDVRLAAGPDDADFIVNVLFDLSPAEKEKACRLLERARGRDLPMICANPDLVVNVGDALKECPGTYALYYEQIGGTVIYHGKPHAKVYELAWSLLGRPDKARIAAVGDSLHTDIQGANNFGIASVMNLAGIHREEWQLAPGEAGSAKVAAMLAGQPHRPDALLNGFCW